MSSQHLSSEHHTAHVDTPEPDASREWIDLVTAGIFFVTVFLVLIASGGL